jgi:hypothetical protein
MLRAIFFFVIFCFAVYADLNPISVISIKKLKKFEPTISYQMIHKPIKLQFNRFPLASSKSSTWECPVLPATFILHIPKGRIIADAGYVLVKEKYLVSELLWPWSPYKKRGKTFTLNRPLSVKHIPGKVVVLSQEGHKNYYHWILEILPKLALLKNIKSYDWVYLPRLDLPFLKKTLELMGMDMNKIIEADPTTYIEADEVIALSFVSRSCYTPQWVTEYLRASLLKTMTVAVSKDKFSQKVFISRQKSSHRRITNEDELFGFLELLGFKRYFLEELSMQDQMSLFSSAKMIVSPHGAGLTNILFCQPGTKILELFQLHEDDTYCYLSQVLMLDYHALKTTPFKKGGGYTDTSVSLDLFRDFVTTRMIDSKV